MLKNTYSPLSKPNSAALIIIFRTESGDAHSTMTEKIKTKTRKGLNSNFKRNLLMMIGTLWFSVLNDCKMFFVDRYQYLMFGH